MSELRHRRGDGDGNDKAETAGESDHVDSEEEKVLEEKYVDELAKNLPQGTDKTPEILDSALSGLSSRWRNWVIRGIFTWLMIGGFCLLIYGGPLALMTTVLCVQVKCFEEIINIGYAVYRVHGLPWFRSLSWYFLLTSNYFFYGENLIDYFGVVINRTDYLRFLVTYHRFISFCLYCIGFVWFVLSLVKKYYMRQFSLFAWTHVALLIVVTQSYLIIQNIFEAFILDVPIPVPGVPDRVLGVSGPHDDGLRAVLSLPSPGVLYAQLPYAAGEGVRSRQDQYVPVHDPLSGTEHLQLCHWTLRRILRLWFQEGFQDQGLRRRDPRSRRHHGPLRLPVPDGHFRQRLHHQLHTHRHAAEAAAAGIQHETGTAVATVLCAERVTRTPEYTQHDGTLI